MTAPRCQKPRAMRLLPRRSRFVDIFRTTPPRTVCPNFFVLAHANGCGFAPGCDYCYLKSSFRGLGRAPRVFSNTADLLREVERWIDRDGLESHVLNTGNLCDSLAFEARRPLAGQLVDLFRRRAEARGRPHTVLFLTKGGRRHCAAFRDRRPCRNVIVSFSVNAPAAATAHEPGTATVADRLAAAGELLAAGWRVRLRIDPMIDGFDYAGVIGEVAALKPERVTLGTLRAEASLRRLGDGLFAALEPPADPGGMARYPLATRLRLYGEAVTALRPVCSLGLCEETPGVWDALGLPRADTPCNCAS